MKTRADLLNHLAEKYNLKKYLEIGVQDPKQNFDKIICPIKIGVDPDFIGPGFIRKTSDNFFREIFEREKQEEETDASMFIVDLVFIDGLHTAEQVKKDFESALKILSPNGFIVLHDCNPLKEEYTIVPRPIERGHWNGDVYKFAIGIEKDFAVTVDIDNGCLVFSNKKAIDSVVYRPVEYLNWGYFDKNRKELLNLISWDEFISIGSYV